MMGPFYEVMGPDATQKEVSKRVTEDLYEHFIKGLDHNSFVFGYGNTNSGKTHSIFGDFENPENWGICPLLLKELLWTCREGLNFYVSVVEIYFDEVLDILNDRLRIPVVGVNELVIRNKIKQEGPRLIEDKNGIIFGAKEVTEIEISKFEDIVKFMKLIKEVRTP